MGRTLALRVERLEALLQLALAKSAGSGVVGGNKPVLGVIYREGAATSGNVLGTWAEVETAIANANGVLRVYVDSSVTSPSTVQTGHVTECFGNVELWPYRKNAAVRDTLVVKDGSTLHRIRGVFGPLTLQVENVTTAGLTFANDDELVVQGDAEGSTAVVEGLTGATLPVIDLHAVSQAIVVEATYANLESDQVGVPFFALGSVSEAVVTASFVVYEGLLVTGTAGSSLEIANLNAATLFPPTSALAGFTGGLLQGIAPNAPGTSNYDTPWFAMTDVYWDPQAGNDNSSGALGAPVLTFAEIVRRYGGSIFTGNYGQSVRVHMLSAQPAGQDPVFLTMRSSNGGQLILDCTAAWAPAGADFAAGALGGGYGSAGAAPSAGGTEMTMAAVPGYVVAGVILENTTRNSFAVVDSVTAGTASLSQPQTLASLTTTTALAAGVVDNDWVAGDNIHPIVAPNVNLKKWDVLGGDLTAGNQPSAAWVIGGNIADTSGTGASEYAVSPGGAQTVHSLCIFSPRVHESALQGRGNACAFLSCLFKGQYAGIGGNAAIQGCVLQGGANILNSTTFANNTVVHGAVGITNLMGGTVIAGAFADGTWTVDAGSAIGVSGFFWGAYNVVVNPGGTYWNTSGSTFVLKALLTTGTQKFGTQTTGSKYQGAGVFVDGVALNPTNIDAGGTGGAGLQDPLTGARFCNSI